MATPSRGSVSARRPGRPPRGWVRKNLHIDQRKLNIARKALGVKTETEAVDAALDAYCVPAGDLGGHTASADGRRSKGHISGLVRSPGTRLSDGAQIRSRYEFIH